MTDEKKAGEKKTGERTQKAGGVGTADGSTRAAKGAQDAAPKSGAAGGFDAGKTEGAAAAKPTVSHMLGELVWLLSQSPAHKHFSIGDLEWMVMPPILLEQFRVFHGDKHPLGFALWAWLSEEAEARFKAQVEAGRGARLRPDDWKSGDRLWLVELVAPFATAENKMQEAMVGDLVNKVFKTRPFRLHVIDPQTGKKEMKEVAL